jgi:glycosyltransferase involved in cell wall biosynthesis
MPAILRRVKIQCSHREGTLPVRPVTKTSVIIPAYNEAGTVEACVRRVVEQRPAGLPIEVIVVESNSHDDTRHIVTELARDLPIRLVLEDAPRGKGSAVRRALAEVTGEVVIIQDADLEYDPIDYDSLVKPIVSGETLFVLGSRVLGKGHWAIRKFEGKPVRELLFNAGGHVVNGFFNLLYGTHFTDQATMYKVFHVDATRAITWVCDSWDFDVEILAKLVRSGVVPIEVPVHYRARTGDAGKKMRLRDVLTVVHAIVRFRL